MNTIQLPASILEELRDIGKRIRANDTAAAATWESHSNVRQQSFAEEEDRLSTTAGKLIAEHALPLVTGCKGWKFWLHYGVRELNGREHVLFDHLHVFSRDGRKNIESAVLLTMPYPPRRGNPSEAVFPISVASPVGARTFDLTAVRLPGECGFHYLGWTQAYLIGVPHLFLPTADIPQVRSPETDELLKEPN